LQYVPKRMSDWQSAANTIEGESAGTTEVYWTRNTEVTETQRIKRQNGRIRDRIRRCKSSGRTREEGGNERRARGGKGVLKVVVEVCFVPILMCICC
jgi:hypothetical protein